MLDVGARSARSWQKKTTLFWLVIALITCYNFHGYTTTWSIYSNYHFKQLCFYICSKIIECKKWLISPLCTLKPRYIKKNNVATRHSCTLTAHTDLLLPELLRDTTIQLWQFQYVPHNVKFYQTSETALQFHFFLLSLKVWMNDLTAAVLAARCCFTRSWWCSLFDLVEAGVASEFVAR